MNFFNIGIQVWWTHSTVRTRLHSFDEPIDFTRKITQCSAVELKLDCTYSNCTVQCECDRC